MVACMYASKEVDMELESTLVCHGVTVKRIEQVGALGNALYKKQLYLYNSQGQLECQESHCQNVAQL